MFNNSKPLPQTLYLSPRHVTDNKNPTLNISLISQITNNCDYLYKPFNNIPLINNLANFNKIKKERNYLNTIYIVQYITNFNC
jgi:hypothetical protein